MGDSMKKIVLLCLVLVMLLPMNIFAIGSINVDTDDIYVIKGESTSFNIVLNNAAGRIDVTSSNENVATVSSSSIFLDANSEVITINGVDNGEVVIDVYAYDVSTYDGDDLTDNTYSINVYVCTMGDINNDDKMDLNDVVTLLKKYLHNDISTRDIKLGDMDNNGIIGLNDIVLLIREYLSN